MDERIADSDLREIGDRVAEVMGWNLLSSHGAELRRGIAATAKELELEDSNACARRLLCGSGGKREMQLLINHLTVGETYFFREHRSFEELAVRILPQLIRSRRDGQRRLNLWSAACCTGEEAYSIAIVLRQVIPDWQDWNITLLATDINSRFLSKAAAGVYGQWSFRETAREFQQRYFRTVGHGQFEILPDIKRMVRFAQMNLMDESYPSAASGTEAVDVIFCRNVLMYFSEPQAQSVLHRLCRAQADGGWLIIGSGEMCSAAWLPYARGDGSNAMIHRKGSKPAGPSSIVTPTVAPEPVTPFFAVEEQSDVVPVLVLPRPTPQPVPLPVLDLKSTVASLRMAYSLADQGKLLEALNCCDEWIAADRLNSSAHYLRAVILQEQGAIEAAAASLRTAVYLEPNRVAVHFALGNVARQLGHVDEAARHLKNARDLLRGQQRNEPVPDCEGVTVDRLIQIVDSLLEVEAAA